MRALPPKPVITNENEQRDFDKFFVGDPDANFSIERNNMIIEEAIKKHEAQLTERRRKLRDSIGERIEAITSWLFSVTSEHTPIEKYFGKKLFMELRAKKISETLQKNSKGQLITKLSSLD